MQITIDAFFILLSLSALLLVGIFILLLILLWKSRKKSSSWELWLIQEQIQFLSKTLDSKLSENTQYLQKNMGENLQHQSRVSETAQKNIESLTKKLTELGETNKEIKEIWDRLEGLEDILKNPKRRWNLGEYFLSELLENVFSPSQFQLQYPLSIWVVDAALFIGNKIIPIDSKFPQENYTKLNQSEDEYTRNIYSKELKKDIKTRIDETSKYILPDENTTDFSFMLIPAEWLYYDIFIANVWWISTRELITYGFSKKVIICSPSWFYAYLQTVIQGMKSLQIEEKAKEIQKYVLKLQKDLHSYEETFSKLGNSLNTTVNHYNSSTKRLRIIDKDILKINPDSDLSLTESEEIDKIDL